MVWQISLQVSVDTLRCDGCEVTAKSDPPEVTESKSAFSSELTASHMNYSLQFWVQIQIHIIINLLRDWQTFIKMWYRPGQCGSAG